MAHTRLFNWFFGRTPTHVVGYDDIVWRVCWLFVATSLVAYASYLYFGSLSASIALAVPTAHLVATSPRDGEHHLTGTIMVPTTCHNLTVQNVKKSAQDFELILTTWHESSRTCPKVSAVKEFKTVLFTASKSVQISAQLDGTPIPVTVEKR